MQLKVVPSSVLRKGPSDQARESGQLLDEEAYAKQILRCDQTQQVKEQGSAGCGWVVSQSNSLGVHALLLVTLPNADYLLLSKGS